MGDYSDIKDEIEEKTGRHNDEFTGLLDEFVNDTVERIVDDMNFWFMKDTTSYSLSSSDDPAQYSLLAHMKEIDEVYLVLESSYKQLDIVSLNDALKIFSPNPERGEPESVVVENQTITVFPPPLIDYTLYVVFWSRFTELEADDDTNFLIAYKKKLVVAGALSAAFAFLQEYVDAEYWESKFLRQMTLLRREHNSRILSGETSLVPKSDIKATVKDERHRVGGSGPSGYY